MSTGGRHHRHSIRLPGYDYRSPGMYFVTACTEGREPLFGTVANGAMVLNDAGRIVAEEWQRSVALRSELRLDAFVIMPNHIHGVVGLLDGAAVGAYATRAHRSEAHSRAPLQGRPPRSLGSFVAQLKATTTKRINDLRGTPGVRVWQRNYYEHIIRNESALARIRAYIAHNPTRWGLDRENPDHQGGDEFDQWLDTQASTPRRSS